MDSERADDARGGLEGIEAVLADLEQQAHGLHLREREEDVAALAAVEQGRVTVEERVHGSLGRQVRVRIAGGEALTGEVGAAGRGWVALEVGVRTWWLRLAAVATVTGLGARALVEEARPAAARLGIGAPLRSLAERRAPVVVLLRDGTRIDGTIVRVGADFLEVRTPAGDTSGAAVEVVPYAALTGVSALRE